MAGDNEWAGDTMPPKCEIIEVRVTDLDQLFHTIDPSPFHERQLDRDAEEFIVNRAREIPRDVPLGLTIYLDRSARGKAEEEAGALRDAVHRFFARRADGARRELAELFKQGRVSLVIGLLFMGFTNVIGQVIGADTDSAGVSVFVRESLIIAGWVAMWRPLEIFLYDWWPIRDRARRYDRLAGMPVAVQFTGRAQAA